MQLGDLEFIAWRDATAKAKGGGGGVHGSGYESEEYYSPFLG